MKKKFLYNTPSSHYSTVTLKRNKIIKLNGVLTLSVSNSSSSKQFTLFLCLSICPLLQYSHSFYLQCIKTCRLHYHLFGLSFSSQDEPVVFTRFYYMLPLQQQYDRKKTKVSRSLMLCVCVRVRTIHNYEYVCRYKQKSHSCIMG